MSYHFYIKNNTAFTYSKLLLQPQLPEGTRLPGSINPEETVAGFSKFYLPGLSSRGVALEVGKEYDIILNSGCSKEDYLLGARLALALASLNNSLITPEFDDELSPGIFESRYNTGWAKENRHLGVGAAVYIVNQKNTIITLSGCIRPYYLGHYVLGQLGADGPADEVLYDRITEAIKRVQFIEQEIPDIEFPMVRVIDFPDKDEKDKEICVVVPGFTVLLPKVDYIILNRKGIGLAKIPHDVFLERVIHNAQRVDECQYILSPLNDEEYNALIMAFKETEIQNKQPEKAPPIQHDGKTWWQFWKKA